MRTMQKVGSVVLFAGVLLCPIQSSFACLFCHHKRACCAPVASTAGYVYPGPPAASGGSPYGFSVDPCGVGVSPFGMGITPFALRSAPSVIRAFEGIPVRGPIHSTSSAAALPTRPPAVISTSSPPVVGKARSTSCCIKGTHLI